MTDYKGFKVATRSASQYDKSKDRHLFDSRYYLTGTWAAGQMMPASAGFTATGSLYITTPANLNAQVFAVDVFTDKNMWVELWMYPPYGQNQAGMSYRRYGLIKNTDAEKKLTFDLGSGVVVPENTRISVRYALLTGETGSPKISLSADIDMKSIDTDADKPYCMYLFTDSIGWAVGGLTANTLYAGFPAFGCEYYPSLLKSYIEDKYNTSIRLQTNSFGGSNSGSMLQNLRSMGGAPYCDIGIVSEGMNDSANAVISPEVYVANCERLVRDIKNRNNKCTVFLFAPSSTDDTIGHANIGAYREVLRTLFVGTFGGEMTNLGGYSNGFAQEQRIIYVDLSFAYPASSITHFSDSNPKIHPNVTMGHPAIFNVIKPMVDNCPWEILS